MVNDLLRRLFGGEARPLISHLLKDENLSLDDLAYLEEVIARKREGLGDGAAAPRRSNKKEVR